MPDEEQQEEIQHRVYRCSSCNGTSCFRGAGRTCALCKEFPHLKVILREKK